MNVEIGFVGWAGRARWLQWQKVSCAFASVCHFIRMSETMVPVFLLSLISFFAFFSFFFLVSIVNNERHLLHGPLCWTQPLPTPNEKMSFGTWKIKGKSFRDVITPSFFCYWNVPFVWMRFLLRTSFTFFFALLSRGWARWRRIF